MKMIDFRCRPSTKEYLAASSSGPAVRVMRVLGTTPPQPTSIEGWVEGFVAHDIERVVFTGRQSADTRGIDVDNDYVAGVVKRFPDRVTGFAGIDPTHGAQSLADIEHAITVLGLKGVSIDPFGGDMAPNDPRLYPVYSKCRELDVPVVVTCGPLPFPGPRLRHGDVRAIDDVATDFPELTIVIDHSGWPWVGETIAIAFRHDHVYIDTSLYSHLPGASLFAEAANTIIPDKIMFASCFPVIPIAVAVERLMSLPFTPESRQRVFHDNADEFLQRFKCY